MIGFLKHPSRGLMAGAAVGLIAAGSAFGAGAPASSAASTAKPAAPAKLATVEINGDKIPLPVALQVVKSALNRPWSSSSKDRNLVVCRTPELLGTHLRTLRCETNAEHMRKRDQLQMNLVAALAGAAHSLPVNNITDSPHAGFVNVGAVQALMAKLPPPNASYTLRVTDHGKPEFDYVFKNGALVHTYHYIYENSQPQTQ